jgi:hypothetical protein
MVPPQNTGNSSVCARLPISGTSTITSISTKKTSTMPIHIKGAAANMRQPSPHQAVP